MRNALAVMAVLLLLGAGGAGRVTELAAAPAAAVEQPAPETKPATVAEVIARGVEVEVARKTLRRHGYDKWDVPLAISSGNESIALDTCCIDDNITLILAFDKRTKRLTSLSLYMKPDVTTVKHQVVERDVLEMSFEKDGVYTVKLKRKADSSKVVK